MRRRRTLTIALAIVVAGLLAWRFTARFGSGEHPAIVTPRMSAHNAVAPPLRMRVHRFLEERGIERGPVHRPRLIALTFDDGPYPIFTPLLLTQLRRLDVPATFFLIGRDAQRWPEITQRIENDGNEIGDHTYSHPDLDRESDAQVREEILYGRDALWALVHDPSVRRLMRPPHGRYTEATLRVAQRLGYTVVLWTDDSGDWRTLSPQTIQHHMIAYATAPEIVLLHSGKLATIEALPAVVERFRASGYQFVTAGQLLRLVPTAELNHPERHVL